MTPVDLRTIGEKLYGQHWQTQLAKVLPVEVRTVRRWLAGKRSIHPAFAARIRDLASQQDSTSTTSGKETDA